MGLCPEYFLPWSKTTLASINANLESIESETVITTQDITKLQADHPIMVSGQDSTLDLFTIMVNFYYSIFGPHCTFVCTLQHMKQVAKTQERNYQTTEVFDCHIGSPMTSQLVMEVQELFKQNLSEQLLQAGILPVTTQFYTYLQFMSMGVNHWVPVIAESKPTPVSVPAPTPAAQPKRSAGKSKTGNKKAKKINTKQHTLNPDVTNILQCLGYRFHINLLQDTISMSNEQLHAHLNMPTNFCLVYVFKGKYILKTYC